MLHCEHKVLEDNSILTLLALVAQSLDRPQESSVFTVISTGGHKDIMSSLIQKAISSAFCIRLGMISHSLMYDLNWSYMRLFGCIRESFALSNQD